MFRKRDLNRGVRNISLFLFFTTSLISVHTFGQKKDCTELIGSISNRSDLTLKFQAINCIEFTCLGIDSLFASNDSVTLDQAKIICNLLSQRNCTSSKIFLKYSEQVVLKEPTYNALFNLAKRYSKLDSLNKAYLFFTRAQKIARLEEQKSDCFLGIAKLLEKQKHYEKAKEFGELAAELNSLNQESFVFLAELFEKAISFCEFKSELTQCGMYLIIAKLYQKAGLNKVRDTYIVKSKIDELLKTATIQNNQTIKIACFIHKEIALRK